MELEHQKNSNTESKDVKESKEIPFEHDYGVMMV